MKKLVISLPTRGRPQQLLDTIRRSTANLVLPNTVLMVQVDADDEATEQAVDAAMDARMITTSAIAGNGIRTLVRFTRCAASSA